ncbi:hypothetical protein L202_00174 [Cryptococcus amylolentus CBS 6039]|uniref:Large ribosomal subunit protein mL49 n=2 Tax=Cryptococcus amylolentus TaxID=104669 RepID=A0A1E3I6I1_9TREE|nr:hypothetical protein L202_00174 [Cryptococcus amylolentus CBS 6039]ODN84172.1 hypothetical protein L202_00174 [Cryptococcus amylolentus CBS 6039]ODO11969.1 hypothetical protein I350_00753 [Cryptococcus amylolentus CBS 6273]
MLARQAIAKSAQTLRPIATCSFRPLVLARSFQTTPFFRNEAPSTSAASSSSSTTAAPLAEKPAAPLDAEYESLLRGQAALGEEGELEEFVGGREKWYHVARSEGGELPVYSKFRNGGQVTTLIRKIEGSGATLRDQLNEFFLANHLDPFTAPPRATLRPTTGHIQIKGHHVEDVKDWLAERGF